MIQEKLKLLPNQPGCYLMKNKDNVVIYVGKAKNLKNRVTSYFRGKKEGKTKKLVSEIVDFEYVVVSSETESLILEINLIKKYDPKYNILLRDDKSYPYIELTNEKIPRLLVIRNLNKKKNKNDLYGPFPNVTAARNTVNLLNRMYPLRKCKTMGKKPCLYYHIHECLGYCTKEINEEEILKMKEEIKEFLKGNHDLLTNKIKQEMEQEASKLNFEKAKELKEMLDYISITLTKQKVEIQDSLSRDVFGFYSYKGYLSIQVFFIRSGKIIERHGKIFPIVESIKEDLESYIAHFYQKNFLLPKEILVPNIVDTNILESFFQVHVHAPIKGVKASLVKMASENAKISLDNNFLIIQRNEERTTLANEELKNILKLEKLDRIELFDNSNLFGSFNVSGMVVFENGVPNKNEYRKFKITQDVNDDYGTMREVTYRRYFRVLKDDLKRPDLIIVDGGIGQMNVVREVVNSLNLHIMVVGLKKNEHHATEALLAFDPIEEIFIDKKSNLFYYLERMQDEVHNFTISYHKQIRSKGSLESFLDHIEGIGEKRKTLLLKKYKTVSKLKTLSIEELEEILPKKVAENLFSYLQKEL
jgi:excinuclease ABC subunit C